MINYASIRRERNHKPRGQSDPVVRGCSHIKENGVCVIMNKRVWVLFTFALLFVIPLGVAAQSVNPGTTTTTFGIPVQQTLTGLAASTAHDVRCTSYSNDTVEFTTDSDGKATVSLTPPEYGQNTYVVCLDAGGSDILTFSIENMDIMPYIIVLITISILFGVLRMFTGGRGGLV